MSRISGIDPQDASPEIKEVLEAQRSARGAAFANHLIYARRPDLFLAVRGMWGAMDSEDQIGEALVALINRHVASINDCAF